MRHSFALFGRRSASMLCDLDCYNLLRRTLLCFALLALGTGLVLAPTAHRPAYAADSAGQGTEAAAGRGAEATARQAAEHPDRPGEQVFAEGTVALCFDGDTLKLTDRRVVRLAGIDAPELGQGKKPAGYYSREARRELTQLAQGRKVRLVQAGVETRDAHGRLIADVLLEDGQSLNDLMVRQGAAFFYPHQDLTPHFQERLRSLQQEAVAERRGFWAHLLSLPLARANYTGNRASLRFFPADCREAERLKPRNRVYFGTLMDAFLAGYAPARNCIFWPPATAR